METVNIDAKGKKIGRIASQAAFTLLGKQLTDHTRHNVADVKVVIQNASSLLITEKKLQKKQYARYSGFPGGLTFESLGSLITKKGHGEALRKAVYGMLPPNKLRSKRMKRLIIED